jgi:LPXTG-motif cell wall-anchored protein
VTEGEEYPHDAHAPLVGEQRLPGTATEASLTVRARWINGFEEQVAQSGKVEFGGACEQDQPKPNAAFASACDGTVTVTLANAEDAKAPAAFTVTGEAGFSQKATVEPGGSKELVVPAESAGHITVTVGDKTIAEHAWQQPADCAPVKVAFRSDCDSLTISIENPAGSAPVQATVTSGDKTETLTLAPGETKEVTFDAQEGTVAIVTIGDESLDVAWEQPEGCVPAGPGLPVTGASVGGVIAVGLALLIAGAGLLVLFRRRRGTFAA